ncbi:hypothetical protein BZM26_24245 [Paraburkholderia strydomiana]|nr:hypothetical protein BZM26_24245 [Paraburkholderia strydomiana]
MIWDEIRDANGRLRQRLHGISTDFGRRAPTALGALNLDAGYQYPGAVCVALPNSLPQKIPAARLEGVAIFATMQSRIGA